MADWRRKSIAGGPSPSEGSHGALHLDFFYRPSAAGVAFPCGGAGGTTELVAAIRPTPRQTKAIADEPFPLPAADGDNRMALAPPATLAPPLQPLQCPRRHASRDRVSCPSSSELPSIPEQVSDSFDFDNDETGDDEWGMPPGHSEDEDEQASGSERSEEGDEALPSGCGEEDDEALPSGSDEVEDGDEAMSSLRRREEEEEEDDDDDEDDEEDESEVPDECRYCRSMNALVMLLPCRHVCYCRECFNRYAGLHCPVPDCGDIIERSHDLSGRLAKRK